MTWESLASGPVADVSFGVWNNSRTSGTTAQRPAAFVEKTLASRSYRATVARVRGGPQ